jgi:hypothetical protein
MDDNRYQRLRRKKRERCAKNFLDLSLLSAPIVFKASARPMLFQRSEGLDSPTCMKAKGSMRSWNSKVRVVRIWPIAYLVECQEW